jgi:hypothetical protein
MLWQMLVGEREREREREGLQARKYRVTAITFTHVKGKILIQYMLYVKKNCINCLIVGVCNLSRVSTKYQKTSVRDKC